MSDEKGFKSLSRAYACDPSKLDYSIVKRAKLVEDIINANDKGI